MSNPLEMSKSYWRDAQRGKQMEHGPIHSVYMCTNMHKPSVIVEMLKSTALV